MKSYYILLSIGALLYSQVGISGSNSKVIKGTVITYDAKSFKLYDGNSIYTINNEKIKYAERIAICNQLFTVKNTDILKIDKTTKPIRKPICKKRRKSKVVR